MKNSKSTVDNNEVLKFDQHAQDWWDVDGPLKTLHDINPIRLGFIKNHVDLNQLSVLDVGCGGGILSEGMAKLGAKVVGIDASVEAINTARQHALDNNVHLDYEAQLIEDYDHPGFDVVTCLELLEHVQHPEVVIEHCSRLLKPNGLLFLSTISRTVKAYASAVIAAEYILKLLPKQTHEYKKFIKPSELLHMARAVGMTLVDMKGLEYNPFSRTAQLNTDVSVNYLLVLKK